MLSQHDLLQMTPIDRQIAGLSFEQGLYFAGDEGLRLSAQTGISSVTVRCTGTFFSFKNGYTVFSFDLSPDADRGIDNAFFSFDEGVLINATVFTTGSVDGHGGCYVRLFKIRGLPSTVTILDTLMTGYVDGILPLNFPPRVLESQNSGRGRMRSITGSDPAAGAEISEAVPTNALWKVHGLLATLVTDATVTNRSPHLQFTDGTTACWRGSSAGNQAASGNAVWNFGVGLNADQISTIAQPGQISPDIYLPEGFTVETITGNLQAGDNWGAPQLLVEEWIVD